MVEDQANIPDPCPLKTMIPPQLHAYYFSDFFRKNKPFYRLTNIEPKAAKTKVITFTSWELPESKGGPAGLCSI